MTKRIISQCLTLLFLLYVTLLPAAAVDDGGIQAIDVDVVLNHTGDAAITETWDVMVPDSWTECYTPKNYLGDMEIKDFTVTDTTTGTKYTYIGDDWDYEESRSEKAGKCGTFEDDDGATELCWGVGSSGHHVYQISYTYTNAVKEYTDGYDGFNIRFINDDMDPMPENASVTISALDENGKALVFTSENTRFWAFGLDATTELTEDGKVFIDLLEDGEGIQYCNVLMRFEDGLFEPTSISDYSFETVRDYAFDGADFSEEAYDEYNDSSYYDGGAIYDGWPDDEGFSNGSSSFDALLEFLTPILLFGVGVLVIVLGKLYNDKKKKINFGLTSADVREADYFRDLPLEGNLTASYYLVNHIETFAEDSRIMTAYVMGWFQKGYITLKETEAKKFLGLVGNETQNSIVFPKEMPSNLGKQEARLWNLLVKASGGDLILQEKELERWASSHYKEISEFYEDVDYGGLSYLRSKNYIDTAEEKFLFIPIKREKLTETGRVEAMHLYGLKRYLKDYTLIQERQAVDASLWGDYLVYACLFGIAEEVAKQFNEILPDYFTNPEKYGYPGYAGNYNTFDAYDMILMTNMIQHMSHAFHNGYQTGLTDADRATFVSSSGGGGGFSSFGGGGFGGGGGFSGGGSGGGGR